jgi:hypothetical protein
LEEADTTSKTQTPRSLLWQATTATKREGAVSHPLEKKAGKTTTPQNKRSS